MPLFWLGISFISGILFASQLQPNRAVFWAVAVAGSLILSLFEWQYARRHMHTLLHAALFRVPAGLMVAAFALGGLRFDLALPRPGEDDLAHYQPRENAIVTGTIISFPELSSRSSVAIVQADALEIGGANIVVHGKLELRLPAGFHLYYGDRVRLTGPLTDPLAKGKRLMNSALIRRGVLSRMAYPQIEQMESGGGKPLMAALFSIRDHARQFLENNLPQQEATLLSGILLGIDWRIPDYLWDAYRSSGTAHVIAISGFNIAIICALVMRFFRRFFSPLKAGVWALVIITAYVILVGAEAAVVRAAVMGAIALPAAVIGRRVIGPHSLAVAASAMLLGNPFLLWDTGFELSFLATMGLMVLTDPLLERINPQPPASTGDMQYPAPNPLLVLLVSTLSAQFAVLPVILQMNPTLQPFALLANLLLLPLQPPLMIMGGMAVMASFLSAPLGVLLLRVTWPLARLCNVLAIRAGLMPLGEMKLPLWSAGLAAVVVFPVMAAALFMQLRHINRSRKSFRETLKT